MDGSTIITRWRQCAPLHNACFLWPRRVQIPNASRSVRPFLHSSRLGAPLYFTMGRPLPSKLPLLTGDLDPHITHDSLGPSDPIIQTAYRSIQSFLQGSLLWQTDRQTDTPTDHAILATNFIFDCEYGSGINVLIAEIWRFFVFFQIMAAVRQLGFVMCMFGPPTTNTSWYLSLCKIWLESMGCVDI